MIRAINKLLDPVRRQVRNSIARGVLTLINDATALQRVQVQLMAYPQPDGSIAAEISPDIEVMAHYGFTCAPFPGAEAAYVAVGGVRAHGLVIATDDRRHRPVGLLPGESMHYDDQGQRIYISRAGIVIDGAGLPVTVMNTPSLTVNASVSVTLNTPSVTCTGTLTVDGLITGKAGVAVSGGAGIAVSGGTVIADGIDLKAHVHGGVAAGSADTSLPIG